MSQLQYKNKNQNFISNLHFNLSTKKKRKKTLNGTLVIIRNSKRGVWTYVELVIVWFLLCNQYFYIDNHLAET